MTIAEIEQAFREGKTVVSFPVLEAGYIRDLLRRKSRAAGKAWSFATLPGEVFVKQVPSAKRIDLVRKRNSPLSSRFGRVPLANG